MLIIVVHVAPLNNRV